MIRLQPPDDAFLLRGLMATLARELNARLERAVPALRGVVATFAEAAVIDSPTYTALVSGELRGELGVTDPEGAVHSVLDVLASSAFARFAPLVPRGASLHGSLEVGIGRADLADLLGVPAGRFKSEGGHVVDWLEWLLASGTADVVADYDFVAGDFPGSRTGLGVMRPGRGWSVPAQHAGTAADNWLTRAFATVDQGALGEALMAEIAKVL